MQHLENFQNDSFIHLNLQFGSNYWPGRHVNGLNTDCLNPLPPD